MNTKQIADQLTVFGPQTLIELLSHLDMSRSELKAGLTTLEMVGEVKLGKDKLYRSV